MNFEIIENEFTVDGKPTKIISGAVHYFRNMPQNWRDIFKKMKAMGLNCVETYCAWNMHEKKMGEFDFSANLDIKKFIETARDEGLMVIVRPGPYICAEWEFGGLPWWILRYENMPLRCYDEQFLSKVRRYYTELLGRVRPHLAANGGCIMMLQVENEYGSYGIDKTYVSELRDILRESGFCFQFCRR